LKYVKSLPKVADEATLNKANQKLMERINSFTESPSNENPYKIKDELQSVMASKVGVFRTEKELTEALNKVKELKKRYKNIRPPAKTRAFNMDRVWIMELAGNLDVAEVVCDGALRRTESRGAHSRRDYNKRDDQNWLKHTITKYTPEGPVFSYNQVDISRYKPEERKY
jgi:succinate dehydrogenase / fumarate reductase, flavoprotein subunit